MKFLWSVGVSTSKLLHHANCDYTRDYTCDELASSCGTVGPWLLAAATSGGMDLGSNAAVSELGEPSCDSFRCIKGQIKIQWTCTLQGCVHLTIYAQESS